MQDGNDKKAAPKPPKPLEGVLTYAEIAAEIGALVTEKDAAYGSSFANSGAILRVLYPHGVPVERYDDMLAITRVLDKMFRIASGNDGFQGESAWSDVAGYGLLGVQRRQREKALRNLAENEPTDDDFPDPKDPTAPQREAHAGDPSAAAHDSNDVPF